jgi:predicted enzyme related to lactoylglutathione lyase
VAQRFEGKAVWLEINTQRIAEAERFYEDVFGWARSAAHVEPWGALTMFKNRTRTVGTGFLGMAPFQPSRWNVFFSARVDEVARRAHRHGGGVVSAPENAWWGRSAELYDPAGHTFTVIELATDDPPDPARPGDPLLVELRAPEATGLARFYADLLGLDVDPLGTLTWLRTRDYPRVLLRDDPHAPPSHPWIPWFRSLSVTADQTRAERFGAIVQVATEDVPGVGRAAILADPTGAYFGLCRPTE